MNSILGVARRRPEVWTPLSHNINMALGASDGTHARASIGKYTHPNTLLVTDAAINIPRIERVGGRLALLVEPAHTNLCLYSQQFDHATWVKARATCTGVTQVNVETASDGMLTADKLVEDGTAAQTHFAEQTIAAASFTDDTNVTLTVYGKPNGRNWAYIRIKTKANSNRGVWFNFSTGAIGTTQVGATASIKAAANGFYRCRVSADIENGATDPIFSVYLSDADNSHTYDGDGTSGIYLWQSDVIEHPVPQSPVLTTNAAATCATESGYPTWPLSTELQSIFAEQVGSEELSNTGFESAGGGDPDFFANWTESASDGAIADEGVIVHTGSHACKLTAGASTNTAVTQQVTGVTAGQVFHFKLEARGDGTGSGRFKIYDDTNGADIIALTDTGVTGTSYEQQSYWFTVPTGCSAFTIHLICPDTDTQVCYWDDISVKEVTNPSSEGGPPNGCVRVDARFGYAYGVLPDTYASKGIVGVAAAAASLIANYRGGGIGSFASNDETTGINSGSTNPSVDTWYPLIIKFGYLSSSRAKFRVGVDSGSGISWGTEGNYDGAYDITGNLLRIGYGLFGPMHIGGLKIYNRILTDSEIDAGGSP